MQQNPLVSIIVPIYNVEKYLKKCLDSLVNQTLKRIEIIAVNDDSTDRSPQILDEYAQQYPLLIKVFHKMNGGAGEARNFAIDKSTGDYIGFVDSDDWVEPTMYKEMYDKAIIMNADIVVCSMKNHYPGKNKVSNLDIRGNLLDFDYSADERPNLLWNSRPYMCNKIFNRHLFNKKNRFPIGQWYEDSFIIYHLLYEANKISCVPKRFYNYRRERPGAASTSISPKIFDIFKSCDSIINFFYNERKINNPELDKVIEKLIKAHLFVRYNHLWESYKDKKLAQKYTNHVFTYLDKHFPDWKKRYKIPSSKKLGITSIARQNKYAAFLYINIPKRVLLFLSKPIRFFKYTKRKKKEKKKQELHKERTKRLQELGPSFIYELNSIISSVGVDYFLDDDSLRWFILKGNFNPKNVFATIGVFATQEQKLNIHAAFTESGFKLWKEYLVEGKDVGQFYYSTHKHLKPSIHIKFYENDSNSSETFIFYNKPIIQYMANQQSVCKMHYPLIDIDKNLNLNGISIPVPKNPEKFLTQRYGNNWKNLNLKVNLCKQTASKPIEEYGYISSKYILPKKELRKLQLELLDMLDIFEEICKKHSLKYYLSEGTLLGAVRHNGFIPWDDDIDISMPREDYEYLLSLPKDEWRNKLIVWSSDTDINYHLVISKLVSLQNTSYKNTFPTNLASRFSGPAIDIFPLDTIPFDSGTVFKKIGYRIRILRNIILLKANYPIRKHKRNKYLSVLAKILSNSFLQKQIKNLTTQFNINQNNAYIINWSSSYHYSKQVVDKDTYGESVMIEYEGKLRPCPSQYRYLLEKIYGDYMKLPDKHKRVNMTHYTIYDSRKSNLKIQKKGN